MTPDGILSGQPDPRRSVCASACPLVLAAGTRRFVAPWAHVGVHQYIGFVREVKVLKTFRILRRVVNGVPVEVSRTLVSEKPLPDTAVVVRHKADYGDTQSYFMRMGIGPQIMGLLRSAPASGIYWLTSDDLVATKLATDLADAGSLVAHHEGPPATTADVAKPSLPEPAAHDPSVPEAAPTSREIAAFIDDAGTNVATVSGHAAWSVDRPGRPAENDLLATVTLDNDGGTLSFRVERQDATPRPTLRLSVRLLRGANSPFRHILAVETPALRKDAHAIPDPLVGRPEESPPAAFAMDLSDTAPDAARNLSLLAADQWIDVPVMIEGSKTVRITFALGASGQRALQQWRGSTAMHATR